MYEYAAAFNPIKGDDTPAFIGPIKHERSARTTMRSFAGYEDVDFDHFVPIHLLPPTVGQHAKCPFVVDFHFGRFRPFIAALPPIAPDRKQQENGGKDEGQHKDVHTNNSLRARPLCQVEPGRRFPSREIVEKEPDPTAGMLVRTNSGLAANDIS